MRDMDKITLYGANLKITKFVDEHAPNDRREEVTVEGIMRSPSDGYHTFAELYDHRITLFIALCKSRVAINHCYKCDREVECSAEDYGVVDVWRSKVHSDGTSFDGWFIMGIGQNKRAQITYHIPLSRWEETNFAETLVRAPEWDGHTSADVLERLKKL